MVAFAVNNQRNGRRTVVYFQVLGNKKTINLQIFVKNPYFLVTNKRCLKFCTKKFRMQKTQNFTFCRSNVYLEPLCNGLKIKEVLPQILHIALSKFAEILIFEINCYELVSTNKANKHIINSTFNLQIYLNQLTNRTNENHNSNIL